MFLRGKCFEREPSSINFRVAVPNVKCFFCRSKRFMEEVSRRPDILTVYFDTDDGAPFKIDTVVDTLNAMRELYGCFSLLCYGEKTDKSRSTVCFKTGSLEIIYGFLSESLQQAFAFLYSVRLLPNVGTDCGIGFSGKTPPKRIIYLFRK